VYYYGHGSSIFIVFILGIFVLRMVMSRRRQSSGGRNGGPYGGGGGPYGGGPYGGGSPPINHDASSSSSGTPTRTTADPDLRSGGDIPDRPPASPSVFGQSGVPAGWMPDPSGKHQQRYWSGSAWTEHVVTDGVPGTDPLPERP
jgi:hypothetical protein